MQPENLNFYWASLLIEELVRNGVDHFCIAPGSRSAALAVGAARHPGARCVVMVDERGAAFHALGHARATGRPAAVIVTSGTAVANCLPAVVEAAMDRVPLLVLSADRPPELQETGANQTIPQDHIFGDYVRWRGSLPCPDEALDPAMVLTAADQAAFRARRSPAGPVHLNCAFREPLAPVTQAFQLPPAVTLERWRQARQPFTRYAGHPELASEDELQSLADRLNSGARGIFFAGASPSGPAASLLQLAEKLQWPVFPDITSGLRLGADSGCLIPHYDLLLLAPAFRDLLEPELLVRLGHRPTSKRFSEFLLRHRGLPLAVIARHPFRDDPQHHASLRLEADPELLCRDLLKRIAERPASAWLEQLQAWDRAAGALLDQVLLDPAAGLTEPGVARLVSRLAPAGSGLFLASSLSIREMDMAAGHSPAAVTVTANRGASGIDGTIASAAGFAQGLAGPVTLVIGDCAAIHDCSSLAALRHLRRPFVMVVLNNQGGGIFSFLPIAQFPELMEPLFAAPQDVDFQALAAGFGVDYAAPRSLKEFQSVYRQRLEINRPVLIEVRTNRQENCSLQQQLQQKFQQLETPAGGGNPS